MTTNKELELITQKAWSDELVEALRFYAKQKNIVHWRDYNVFKDEIQPCYNQFNESEYVEDGATARKAFEERGIKK